MKVAQRAKFKVIVGIIVGCLIFLNTAQINSHSINLTVDVNQVIADVSNNPVGLGINFLQNPAKITTSLKNFNIGSLRFPDGVLADNYLFDPSNPGSPKIAIQDSNIWQVKSLGKADGTWYSNLSFDDFIKLCHSVGAEPFIVIGIDAIAYTGKAPHANSKEVLNAAVKWVEYANLIKNYDIKYWEIGNENDIKRHGSDEVKWTPEKYARTVVEFSQAMKKVDPSIQIGANGMKGLYPNWWNQIMPIIKQDVDFLVTHQYSWIEDYQQWTDYNGTYDYNLTNALAAINKYKPNLRLNITETSSFNPSVVHTNNTWKMLHNFEMIGQALCFNQIDYVHFWTFRWLEKNSYSQDISSFDNNYQITPIGFSIKTWSKFLKKKMVYTSNNQLQKINHWASYDPDTNSLNLLLLNKKQQVQSIFLKLKNYNYEKIKNNQVWVLKGAKSNSQNTTWQKLNSIPVTEKQLSLQLEPLSVTVVSF